MRAATIAVQLALALGLVAALWLTSAAGTARYERWRVARARRSAARVHLGYEHPIGSREGCPGCESWAASRAAARRRSRARRRWDRNGRRARRWDRIAAERWAGGSISWAGSRDRPTDG